MWWRAAVGWGTEVLMQICLPGILGDGCLVCSFLLAQHSMDLRAMFAQSVQEDCLLRIIRMPCKPGLFLYSLILLA